MTEEIISLSKMIDHSLLHPTMTAKDLEDGCKLAMKYNVASVCVKPYAVYETKKILSKSDVKIGTVIGFPHGNSKISVKVEEAKQACYDGADEIDMVINIGKALEKDFIYIEKEIREINNEVKKRNSILKVIFENDYLDNDTIKELCRICSFIKVDYIKTSTGYGFVKQPCGNYSYDGATESDLKLMHKNLNGNVEVKAAGGIRTLEDLLFVKSIGVTRVGCTNTEQIINCAIEAIKNNVSLESLIPESLDSSKGY